MSAKKENMNYYEIQLHLKEFYFNVKSIKTMEELTILRLKLLTYIYSNNILKSRYEETLKSFERDYNTNEYKKITTNILSKIKKINPTQLEILKDMEMEKFRNAISLLCPIEEREKILKEEQSLSELQLLKEIYNGKDLYQILYYPSCLFSHQSNIKIEDSIVGFYHNISSNIEDIVYSNMPNMDIEYFIVSYTTLFTKNNLFSLYFAGSAMVFVLEDLMMYIDTNFCRSKISQEIDIINNIQENKYCIDFQNIIVELNKDPNLKQEELANKVNLSIDTLKNRIKDLLKIFIGNENGGKSQLVEELKKYNMEIN